MDIKIEISNLISSKREGDYWDFKQEPHANKASLLHDILCLSNSLYKGNKYLIYGVADPVDEAKIIGLKKNQKNRRTQVQFIDFLRTKSFAGDIRPEVELHTIEINNLEIDVLVIFENPQKPYFLKADYRDREKCVRANFTYTRTNDTNTPIDKSADLGVIEKMWRQRFGLDLPPLEKLKSLLKKPNDWFKDIGNSSFAYHLNHPEFRIEFSEVDVLWEVYSFFFTNEKSFIGTAIFKYHSTTLFELDYMYCDEMRITLALPDPAHVQLKEYENWFYYYNLESLDGLFLQFLTDNLKNLHSRSSAFPFVIFKSENEITSFKNYVKENEDLLDSIKPSHYAENAKKRIEQWGKVFATDPLFMDKITQLHKEWA